MHVMFNLASPFLEIYLTQSLHVQNDMVKDIHCNILYSGKSLKAT